MHVVKPQEPAVHSFVLALITSVLLQSFTPTFLQMGLIFWRPYDYNDDYQ